MSSPLSCKRFVCIHLPHWPITRLRRRHSELRHKPLALVRSTANRRLILDASEDAGGIRPGMSLAEARALCPALISLEHDAGADARALEALGRWMMRFTPIVATGWSDEDLPRDARDAVASADPPFLLFLDITGCERVFHGAAALLRQISGALSRLGIPASIAAAPTPGAAWALAFARRQVIVQKSSLLPLAPLPIESLRLDAATLATLHHLGLQTIGQLLALPRELLPVRFGPLPLIRLDQADGTRSEPLIPLVHQFPVEAKIELDGPVDSLETIWAILRKLLERIIADLTRRGRGARRIELLFLPASGKPIAKTIFLSRPSRDPANLFNLFRCATERLEAGDGFLAIHLKVPLHERLGEEQIPLLQDEADAYAGRIEVARLLERLSIRLGESAVLRPQLVESHLPERAWTTGDAAASTTVLPAGVRPLELLPTPLPIDVVAEPCNDRQGRPRQFTCAGQVHSLAQVVGPERICGQWWRQHYKDRDYYDVEDTAGRRFWLFRVITPPPKGRPFSIRWYLHGRFE